MAKAIIGTQPGFIDDYIAFENSECLLKMLPRSCITLGLREENNKKKRRNIIIKRKFASKARKANCKVIRAL